jgi:hypothetical protein
MVITFVKPAFVYEFSNELVPMPELPPATNGLTLINGSTLVIAYHSSAKLST